MHSEQVKTRILHSLYDAWLSGSTYELTLPELTTKLSMDQNIIAAHCRFLAEDWSVQFCRRSDDVEKTEAYRITAIGIKTEEERLRCSDQLEDVLKLKNNKILRKALLEIIQELREEFHSPHGSRQRMNSEYRTLYYRKIEERSLDRLISDRNFFYLSDAEYIVQHSQYLGEDFFFEVSNSGYELLKEYEAEQRGSAEYQERISNYEALKSGLHLTPQARGHELEKLLAPIFKAEGWQCELNVKTSSQENDLIIHQKREYIIIECKWQGAKKASPEHVSRLRDKVSDRPGFRTGVLISMNGFTAGVAETVRNRLSDCMIILLDGQDVEDILYARKTFTALLDEHFHAAMSRTEIIMRKRGSGFKSKGRATTTTK